MKKIIDLHIHTTCSDGALSPKEVIDRAEKNGVSVIAIADHDTVDAYNNNLYEYAKNKGIKLINAVEISCRLDKISVHVLGYNFNIENKQLKEKLNLLKSARYDYLNNVAIKLKELGYALNVSKLQRLKIVTKAHIAQAIIENHLNKKLLFKTFNHIPNKGEFIETIMNKGCPAYVKKYTINPKEASKLIKNAGGKVILAHPVAYKYETDLSDEDILNIIKDMDADGIESNYIYIDKNNNRINEVDKWYKIAKSNNLIVTIGSDFHYEDGIHPDIGLIRESMELNYETLNEIIFHIVN